MAGTVVMSTLSDGTNSTSATNPILGSAKAWVRFNGVTTVTINASYNVSSVTRSSAGAYTVNFTNALADANYIVVGAAWYTGVSAEVLGIQTLPSSGSSAALQVVNTLGSAADGNFVSAAFFR